MAREAPHRFVIYLMHAFAFARGTSQREEREESGGEGSSVGRVSCCGGSRSSGAMEDGSQQAATRAQDSSRSAGNAAVAAGAGSGNGGLFSPRKPRWLSFRRHQSSESSEDGARAMPRLKFKFWKREGREEEERNSFAGESSHKSTTETYSVSAGAGATSARVSENEVVGGEECQARIETFETTAAVNKSIADGLAEVEEGSARRPIEENEVLREGMNRLSTSEIVVAAADAAADQAALSAFVANLIGDVACIVVEALHKGIHPDVAVATAAEEVENFKVKIDYSKKNNLCESQLAAAVKSLQGRFSG